MFVFPCVFSHFVMCIRGESTRQRSTDYDQADVIQHISSTTIIGGLSSDANDLE